MAEVHDQRGILLENLEDAGIAAPEARLLRLTEEGRDAEFFRALQAHRSELLSGIRERQRQIDCLDFLAHRIERMKKRRAAESSGLDGQKVRI